MDLTKMLGDAAFVQSELQAARDRLADDEVQGSAGGGVIRVRLGGDLIVREISIGESIFQEADPELTEDLIRVAVNDALCAVQALAASTLGEVTAGGGLDGNLGDD